MICEGMKDEEKKVSRDFDILFGARELLFSSALALAWAKYSKLKINFTVFL